MSALPLAQWLQVLDREYLSDFIRNGGASVKFAVMADDLRPDFLAAAMQNRCREREYLFVEFDAAQHRAHMPQDIFFAMAEQIDWRLLARRQILRLARATGLGVAGVDPASPANIYAAIGEVNGGLARDSVFGDLRPHMETAIVRNHHMARDFRIAMVQLCINENTPSPQFYNGTPLLEWLTGQNTRISNVRHFLIHTPINRNTARYFLESAFYWIQRVGYAGTVLQFDISRVTETRRNPDGGRYYTRAMAMEHYELLREFIDGADRLTSVLLLVAADPAFLEVATDRRSRGYGIYQALQTRIMNDVRDRHLVNPEAALVRLTSQ